MKLPQLQMRSTLAQLGLNITKPQQYIEQPMADVMMKQHHAEVRINTTPIKLSIDQSQAWEEMGIISVAKSIARFASKGESGAYQAVAEIASEGDELMRIEHGGKPLISQAVRETQPTIREFNIGLVPSPFSVKIHFQPGQLDINIKANKPIIDVKVNKPIHQYTPGNVQGYILQKNSLTIDVVK